MTHAWMGLSLKAIMAGALGTGLLASSPTLASDRELRVVLDQFGCIPERVDADRSSPAVTIFEVSCRRTDRVLKIACMEAKCWLLTPRNKDEEADPWGP